MSRYVINLKKDNFIAVCASILAFLCVFENTFLKMYMDISSVQGWARLGFTGILLVLLFFRKKNYSSMIILCTIFYAWLIILTFWRGGNVLGAGKVYCSSYLIVVLLQYYSDNDEKILCILDTWKWIIFFLVLIDLMSLFLYPDGLYASEYDSFNWFLGYKTSRVLYSLPMCAMFFYTSLRRKNKITTKCWVIFVIAVYDAVLTQATAASVGLILSGIFILIIDSKVLREKKFVSKLVDIKVFYIIYFVITVLLVVAQSADLLGYFSSVFEKSDTFSGRTVIWLNCILSIISSRGIGMGYLTSSQYITLTKWARGTNAHNQVLGILVCGGVIAFLLYYYMIYRSAKTRHHSQSIDHIHKVILMFIYGVLILGVTSDTFTYSTFGFFLIWLLEYSSQDTRHSDIINEEEIGLDDEKVAGDAKRRMD